MKLKLTEARIPSLRTLKPQEDVFHEPTPGAGLRITRKGRKTWFLLYCAPGSKPKFLGLLDSKWLRVNSLAQAVGVGFCLHRDRLE
jgi:hypothetical protein